MMSLLRRVSSVSMASIPSLQSSSTSCISKNIMDSQNCFGGSARLVALAQQLRLYKHTPIDTDIEEEEKEQRVEESAGKVVSQVGFAESATPVANQPEKFRPKRAAVLICLFEGNHGDLRVILTKRSSRLSTHSGEVALPGGKADEADADDSDTATREAQEEIGLDPSLVNVVTVLEPFLSKHLLRVIPVIGILADIKSFKPALSVAEVEEVFDTPLEMFLKDENRRSEEREWMGDKYLIHFFDYGTDDKKYVIWGLTAGILIRAASVVYQRPPNFLEQNPKFKVPRLANKDVQMAEKQKGASSPTNSKEKTSLLDLDIGKDFLTSWKSMSVTEDDSMDFDFSTVAKGKKKIFNFDDVDMDFTLDGDFGKISSFKVDMSDLDVSNSVKKAGKPEERSKEVSADGKLQGKSDRFTFPFDFNEFDSFNFEPSLMKKDKQSSKNQDAEKSSGQSGSRGSGIHLNEHIGALEDNIFLKHGASEGDTTSKFDGQLGRKFDSPNKDEPLKSLINEKCLSKSTTSEDVVGGARTSPEKSISCSTHEPDQESCPPEKITSPESYAQETCKDVSVQSVSGNLSTQDTATDLQEEVGSQARKDGAGTGGDQHIILKRDDSGFNYGNAQSDNLPPDMVCSRSSNGEKRKFEGDNHVQIGYKDGAEPAQGDSQFEQTSITTVSGELLHETVADGEILDSTSEFIASPLSSATTGDKAMPDKERENGVRSKYFNRSVETKSQLQPASLSHIKLTTSGSKRIGAAHQTSANESRKLQTKDAQSGNKLVGLPTSLPRELTRGEPVKIRKQGSIKDLTTNSSHVLLSSLNEQENKSSSQNCQNPRLPVSGMKSIQNTKNNSAEKNKISPLKCVGRTSDPSNLKNMRTTGSSCAPLKLTLQKDFIYLTNSERSMALKGNTESRISHAADTKKQTSSSPTLKRKSLEEASAGLLTLKPMKRLSQSPGESRNLRESSQIIVDKQICNNENLADGTKENVFNNHQSPRLHTPQEVNMNELETPLTMESDTNVKKAEACAKELEDICNMLKKKHEEAKEILVRAVVNNNNLLMLNHPIYEEKIRMIQKFAASLMSK